MADELFRNRTPEAAARQLAIVFASATEFHLATLEHQQMLRSTPKGELKRQASICDTLVDQCIDLDIPADIRGLRGIPCIRLSERLKNARAMKGTK